MINNLRWSCWDDCIYIGVSKNILGPYICLALILMQQAGNGVIKVSTSLCLSLLVRVWLVRANAL